MAGKVEQNYANHTVVPVGFMVQLAGCIVALGLGIAGAVMDAASAPLLLGASLAVLSLSAAFIAVKTRTNALMVQDRVVRLETQVRLERVLPADLRDRARTLTLRQLVGVRFASDGELPGLVQKVLDENIQDSKSIKKLVKQWVPDHMRV